MSAAFQVRFYDEVGIRIVTGGGHHQVLRAEGAAEFEPAMPVAGYHPLNRIAVPFDQALDAVVLHLDWAYDRQWVVDEDEAWLVLAEFGFEPVQLLFSQ